MPDFSLSRLSVVLFGKRLPTDLRGRIRTNSFALASLMGLFACTILAWVFQSLGAGWQVWGMAGGILANLMVIVRHRRHGDVERSLNLLLGIFFALIAFYTYCLGGIRSAGAIWFIVPPYVAVICMLPRGVIVWSAASATALALLYGLELGGHEFHLMAGAWVPSLYLVSLLVLSLMLLSFLGLLGQSREHMIDFLERTNQELREARDEALAAARVKAQFLANMSHEIRTPLNGVLGMAELLNRTRLDQEQARFLKSLHHSGEHLLRLIDDVLDYSRLETRDIALADEAFPPGELVGQLIEGMQVAACAQNLALTCTIAPDVPRQVRGDPARVRQILFNLMANAIKFTPQGSVAVAVRLAPESGEQPVLEFEINDTGIGIDQAELARLFTAFAQVDASTTRPYGGIGLGLAISQELARLMHGGLQIDSASGAGTRVRCTLRFAACDTPDVVAPDASAVGATPGARAVLLVEDNPVNLEVGVAMLEQLGCDITVAHDGAEAVVHWRAGRYDLVLMDCQMPVMDGFDATREMRRQESGRGHTPIVALTANVLREDREACFAAGMDGFLAKPYTLAQLREVIDRHGRQAQAA